MPLQRHLAQDVAPIIFQLANLRSASIDSFGDLSFRHEVMSMHNGNQAAKATPLEHGVTISCPAMIATGMTSRPVP